MPETDLNKVGAVAQQDLNKADVVNQQDLDNAGVVDQQKQDDKLADGTDANKDVKYSDLKKATDRANTEAEARKAAEEQAAYAQRQLELMQQQAVVQANAPQQPLSPMEQALVDCGLTADELYVGENYVKVINRKDQILNANQQQQQIVNANQQFIAQHPDVSQVVGSVNPMTGQIMTCSPELMAILAKKQYLAGACTTVQATYDIVLQERKLAEFEKAQASNQEHQNRQEVDSNTLPMGGSAAGGGGTGDPNNQSLMTREQVLAIREKMANGEEIT